MAETDGNHHPHKTNNNKTPFAKWIRRPDQLTDMAELNDLPSHMDWLLLDKLYNQQTTIQGNPQIRTRDSSNSDAHYGASTSQYYSPVQLSNTHQSVSLALSNQEIGKEEEEDKVSPYILGLVLFWVLLKKDLPGSSDNCSVIFTIVPTFFCMGVVVVSC